jgi:hypothetical protein
VHFSYVPARERHHGRLRFQDKSIEVCCQRVLQPFPTGSESLRSQTALDERGTFGH